MKRWLMAATLLGSGLLGSVLHWSAGVAEAQEGGEEAAPEDPQASRAAAFRAVSGPQAERVPGGTLTVVAYGAAWLVLLGYLWRLGKLHAHNQAELTALRKSLDDASS